MSSSVFLDFAEGILMWLPAALTNVIALNVELFLGQLGSWWHQARTSLARMPMMTQCGRPVIVCEVSDGISPNMAPLVSDTSFFQTSFNSWHAWVLIVSNLEHSECQFLSWLVFARLGKGGRVFQGWSGGPCHFHMPGTSAQLVQKNYVKTGQAGVEPVKERKLHEIAMRDPNFLSGGARSQPKIIPGKTVYIQRICTYI